MTMPMEGTFDATLPSALANQTRLRQKNDLNEGLWQRRRPSCTPLSCWLLALASSTAVVSRSCCSGFVLEPLKRYHHTNQLPILGASQGKNGGNPILNLWNEVIEFSTYGPTERKALKARRDQEAAKQRGNHPAATEDDEEGLSMDAFRAAKSKFEDNERDTEDLEMDGYALRDLLVAKWGVPLDVDFQRMGDARVVYCTVLPVAFGSKRCRHITELDYLMHLQGVVEILHKYENLDAFCAFVETTSMVPKPGRSSVPYRMQLTEEQLTKIL